MKISFFVPGRALPGGSKKAFVIPGTNRANVVDDYKGNKPWRSAVANAAERAYSGELLTGPIEVSFAFVMARPKSHYRAGDPAKGLKANATDYHTGKPDVLKIARSTEDALTGILWRDDCLTVDLSLSKRYGERPGVRITVWTRGEE